MSLLDTLTGGSNNKAQDALEKAREAYASIQAPTAEQLSLPELQQYVQAGILTPAQAQTFLQQGNAFNDIKLDPGTMENEQDAVNKLKAVGDAKGMTPQMQAQLTAALDQVATTNRGNNEAISDQFAQRGIPASLMAEANMRQDAGDAARNANLSATQAAGQAEQNAISAMMNQGNLASTMHGQQESAAENKAQAENAMRQWNAGASNANSEANAGRAQTANQYNAGVKQDVANSNTGLANTRTQYNANVPQQMFNNAITKAGGQAGVSKNQADQDTAAGNQMMGLYGAIAGGAGAALHAADGAVVPGRPVVPGDSPQNDKVHAMLSPGEVIVPRSISHDPEAVKRFVTSLIKKPVTAAHPDDVHSLLEALSQRRDAHSAAARG